MKKLGVLGVLGAVALGLVGWWAGAQQLDLAGPDQLGQCEKASFTITLTNDTSQTASNIVVTLERPTTDYVYVTGSSTITPHTGSPVQADPTENGVYLEWDINNLLGYGYLLPPGKTLTIKFALVTNCDTDSGTLVARASGDGFSTSPSASLSVEILPGAVKVTKTPSVQDAHVGDTVTWTITVESTGLGPIHNVVVTDTLGSGLSYVNSNPTGTSSGQTITWEFDTIAAGDSVSIQLSAQVVSCEGLEDRVDASFGCSDGTACYDTAASGGTATASIHLLVDNPLLDFTPPDIQLPYCDSNGTTVTMTVTNTGDGPASDVRIEVDFPAEFRIQNVQGGASWDGTYFHLPDLAAGESFDLIFDVVYTGDWCAGGPAGELYWQAIYDNVCGDEFRPPAKTGSYGTSYGSAGPPSLSVDLTGDSQVHICSEHTYDLAVSFSGLDSCSGGTTSPIDVTVNVPAGFTVTDPGSGSWQPGSDGTGGTITWTGVDPASGLTTSFTLKAPGTDQCGQEATITATATATDCCGCEITSSASLATAIECYQLVTATHEASPTTQEKCGTITYTHTYQFADDSALDNISFNELTLYRIGGQ